MNYTFQRIKCIEYNAYNTMHRKQCIDYNAQKTLNRIKMYRIQCKEYNAQHTIQRTQCIECMNRTFSIHIAILARRNLTIFLTQWLLALSTSEFILKNSTKPTYWAYLNAELGTAQPQLVLSSFCIPSFEKILLHLQYFLLSSGCNTSPM